MNQAKKKGISIDWKSAGAWSTILRMGAGISVVTWCMAASLGHWLIAGWWS